MVVISLTLMPGLNRIARKTKPCWALTPYWLYPVAAKAARSQRRPLYAHINELAGGGAMSMSVPMMNILTGRCPRG